MSRFIHQRGRVIVGITKDLILLTEKTVHYTDYNLYVFAYQSRVEMDVV